VEPSAHSEAARDATVGRAVVDDAAASKAEIDLIPHYAWSSRSPLTMRVWILVADT